MQVSIIIPCYNVAAYLDRCLQSALAQTYPDVEIICVDNNSTDHTASLLSDYAVRYSDRVRVVQELEQGAPAARNRGLLEAKGKWIQFLDADDYLLPQKIECQIRHLQEKEASERLGILVGDYQLRSQGQASNWFQPEDRNSWLALFTGRLGNTCCNLWLAEAIDSVGGWNNHLKSGQEYELMFRLLQKGWETEISSDQQTMVEVRPESITKGANYRSSILNRFILHLEILNWIVKNESQVYECFHSAMQAYAVKFLRDAIVQYPEKEEELRQKYLQILTFPRQLKNYQIGRAFVLLYNTFGFRLARIFYQWYAKLRQGLL